MTSIPDEIMGDLWPRARPGAEDADYGRAELAPTGRFVARSLQCFTLVYTVGAFGLDDTGAIKIVQRWTNDGGTLQTDDPAAPNYVTARASNGVTLDIEIEHYPHQRPWYNGLRVTVRRGYMRPGDTITILYGDPDAGSPGMQLQSFCEEGFAFKVLVDPCATGVFFPIASPLIDIVAGPPEHWVLVAPTLRRPGEAFSVGIRAEDYWGNATGDYAGELCLSVEPKLDGFPKRFAFSEGSRGMTVGPLAAPDGAFRFTLTDTRGQVLARSNPMIVKDSPVAGYWGDLHGQSGETVGINALRSYFEFARDVAFLDVTSHQANDFHLTNAFWQQINDMSAEFDQDGRFTVFPGYEWSANTPLGGDHNVYFRQDGRQIVRSSHALLEDRSDLDTDAHDLPALFEALKDEDCVVFAHIGGRPADISRAEDARLRTGVEVHSDWGTFEWIMTDAFANGYRVGLVCNSDGHKGAPGACYPGASEFGAYSGLTCFLAPELSRDAIFDAMRRRRHYGTTGSRLHLDVAAQLGPEGAVYPVDPRVSDRPAEPSPVALMGDIARAAGDVTFETRVSAPSPIVSIDVLNGADTVAMHRPYTEADLGRRVRVLFEGAEYRGRGRQSFWAGDIKIAGARIEAMQRFNHWNHDRPFEAVADDRIIFDVVTTGNYVGCDIWLSDAAARVTVTSDLARADIALADIPLNGIRIDAGGLNRNITLLRLPDTLAQDRMDVSTRIKLQPGRDNPLWVRIKTEDGHTAWSSPIYMLI